MVDPPVRRWFFSHLLFGPCCPVEGRSPASLPKNVTVGDVIVSRRPWPILISPSDDSTAILQPTQASPPPNIAHEPEPGATPPNCSSSLKEFNPALSETTTSTSITQSVDSETEQGQMSLDETSSEKSEDSDTSHAQDSLDQLLNAEALEFEIRKDVPGVKSTISGECHWTPVSIKQPSLTDEFETDYLKICKLVGVVKIGSMLRARIQTNSAIFYTPIGTRTWSRTKFKSRLNNEST